MAEILFQAVNLYVLPFWLLMIVLPHWRGTRALMRTHLILLPLPVLYVLLIAPDLPKILTALANPKLEVLAPMLGTPEAFVVAWIHFAAFDLFVGRWIYLDSRERQVHALIMAPILFLTLMLGPAGFLGYLGIRGLPSRETSGRSCV